MVLIGSPAAEHNGVMAAGVVLVYYNDSTVYELVATLSSPNLLAGGRYGHAFALYNGTVAVVDGFNEMYFYEISGDLKSPSVILVETQSGAQSDTRNSSLPVFSVLLVFGLCVVLVLLLFAAYKSFRKLQSTSLREEVKQQDLLQQNEGFETTEESSIELAGLTKANNQVTNI